MAAKKKQTFEEQLAAVEALIERMEGGGLSLDESMKQYEEGVKALAAMEKELREATRRLTVIRRNAEGEDVEEGLEIDE